jgi:Raf kinase inhibitor-like YbhB/YbcL family protein
MRLSSPAFADGERIPREYTCDGANFSPCLEWDEAPAGTTALALVMDDPDAPAGTWTHWLAYNIPSAAFRLGKQIPRDAEHPSGLKQGQNSWGRIGYGGPCPPQGEHRYVFTLLALDAELDLPGAATRAELESALAGHVLDQARLVGRYGR